MKLAIIIGSTREGRKTPSQAKWAANVAKEMDGVDVELIDLRDYPMSFFNEAISPRYNPDRKVSPDVQPWLSKLAEFDAYVFVTPEYNHSITGVLKNALDFVTWEFVHKPGAVISHGSAGGARAATDLKEILSESRLVLVPTGPSLAIVGMSEIIDQDGKMNDEAKNNPYGPHAGLVALLEDLKWFSDLLSPARSKEA
jgi:NAD(P)H-dependent FMN reductase